MLRDIKINKTQFIAIFLMAFLGIFAYCGIYGEYYGLEQTSNGFYAQTNMADGWIYNTDFDDSAVDKVNELFNMCFLNYIDKNELRNYLIEHPEKKQVLEEYIHPLVYKYMDKMFKASNKEILIAEVPLLFESGKENNFDYIVYVDASDENRINRLQERNPNSNAQLKAIYNSKVLDKNKEKADFIIENNGNLLALGEKVDEVFNILLSRLS